MFFWWFMFVCNLLYSVCMILGGWVMWKHCPENRNGVIGYRSKRSKVNRETWQFAHENCGKRWWWIGWLMLLPTVLVQLPFYGKDDDAVGGLGLVICIVECTIMILSIFPTEKALKANFTEDGQRK